MQEGAPRMKIWALLGAHRGDNNQVLALAEALGIPFECKHLAYNAWRHLHPPLLGATFRSLTRQSRQLLCGHPPDLTISTGHRSVPVVRALRRRSGGRTRSVHIGYPRISPSHFDLVVATPEYPIPEHPNLLRIPFALTRARPAEPLGERFWKAHRSPRHLLILGGPTLYWNLNLADVSEAIERLLACAATDGGSVMIVGSPRTPAKLLAQATARIGEAPELGAIVPINGPPSYPSLLAMADTIAVTADSVAMISDAVVTKKPVRLIPVRATLGGRILMRLMDQVRPGQHIQPRDLRFFWKALEEEHFVGPRDNRSAVPDLAGLVADRVTAILAGHRALRSAMGRTPAPPPIRT
jgi:mitochondrial fission protein ELM1